MSVPFSPNRSNCGVLKHRDFVFFTSSKLPCERSLFSRLEFFHLGQMPLWKLSPNWKTAAKSETEIRAKKIPSPTRCGKVHKGLKIGHEAEKQPLMWCSKILFLKIMSSDGWLEKWMTIVLFFLKTTHDKTILDHVRPLVVFREYFCVYERVRKGFEASIPFFDPFQ